MNNIEWITNDNISKYINHRVKFLDKKDSSTIVLEESDYKEYIGNTVLAYEMPTFDTLSGEFSEEIDAGVVLASNVSIIAPDGEDQSDYFLKPSECNKYESRNIGLYINNKEKDNFSSFIETSFQNKADPLFKTMSFGFPIPRRRSYTGITSNFISYLINLYFRRR